jgi:hypothetical protein
MPSILLGRNSRSMGTAFLALTLLSLGGPIGRTASRGEGDLTITVVVLPALRSTEVSNLKVWVMGANGTSLTEATTDIRGEATLSCPRARRPLFVFVEYAGLWLNGLPFSAAQTRYVIRAPAWRISVNLATAGWDTSHV